MSERDDGGPAFPSVGEGFGDPLYSAPGISMRDYFAAKAMQALGAEAFRYMKGEGHATDAALAMMKDIGGVSYRMADAMLAARNEE